MKNICKRAAVVGTDTQPPDRAANLSHEVRSAVVGQPKTRQFLPETSGTGYQSG
jgi:hypothetical protein